jgi:hypothetical protein
MKCIGRCPIDFSASEVTEQIRPSQVTIRGTSAEVCMACGEIVFGAKHARRTIRDARSRRSRISKVGLRQAGYDYNTETELDWFH